jgi:nitrite reductase/ring-hydroxylating ferredoxin subunit
MGGAGIRLCRLEEIPDGDSRGFDPLLEGRDTLFVVRRGSALHAWRDACPHIDGAPLPWRKNAYLNAARDRIVCGAHGALFDIVTGLCTLGPCLGQSLEPMTVELDGGAIYWRRG